MLDIILSLIPFGLLGLISLLFILIGGLIMLFYWSKNAIEKFRNN